MSTAAEQQPTPSPAPTRTRARARELLVSLAAVAFIGAGVYFRKPAAEPVDPATLNLPFKAASATRKGKTIRAVMDDPEWWSQPERKRATLLVSTLESLKDTSTLVVTNAEGKVIARVSNKTGRLEVAFP